MYAFGASCVSCETLASQPQLVRGEGEGKKRETHHSKDLLHGLLGVSLHLHTEARGGRVQRSRSHGLRQRVVDPSSAQPAVRVRGGVARPVRKRARSPDLGKRGSVAVIADYQLCEHLVRGAD